MGVLRLRREAADPHHDRLPGLPQHHDPADGAGLPRLRRRREEPPALHGPGISREPTFDTPKLAAMPPARKRPRAYDPARTRTAVLAQFGNVRAAVPPSPPSSSTCRPGSATGPCGELVAHVGMALTAVDRLLGEPEPARQDGHLLDWPFAIAADADAIAGTARRLAAEHPDPDAHLAEVERRHRPPRRPPRQPAAAHQRGRAAAGRLRRHPHRRAGRPHRRPERRRARPGRAVRPAGPGRRDPAAGRRARRQGTRRLDGGADPAGRRRAVRRGSPAHRGTPPNVVETDPLTWVRLATGRLAWDDAVAGAKVSASGERAALGGLLPLLR